MIKHLLKIIWTQRKTNSWIYAELVVVICAVWWMTDKIWVDLRTFYSPLGYDISNTWLFNMDKLNPQAVGYVSEKDYHSTETDDFLQLMEQIRLHPAVEEAAFSFAGCPYSSRQNYTGVEPVDGDTIAANGKPVRMRHVSPEYFDVFRIKNVNKERIRLESMETHIYTIVITADLAKMLFHTSSAKGRQLYSYSKEDEKKYIDVVCNPIRSDEYKKNEAAFYEVMNNLYLENMVSYVGAEQMELCVRMKQAMSQDDMNLFLREMGDRLTVNNLNIYSVTPISEMRAKSLKKPNDTLRKQLSLMAFLLINVFFGIIGTFWLRTQQRQGELGIRIALGASRFTLKEYLYGEGLCLLFLTLPFTLLFAVNMIYMDIPDTFRLPYTIGRFGITFGGTYLLLAIMICLGIRFPVQKTSRIAPAEAFLYE
jgi:ABC-type antimicrobial peptide transport system permease subunit